MPELIKLYVRQSLIGFAIAAGFVALLLSYNVLNLWTLVSGSDVGLLAVFLLWFFNGIVFAGVQFGVRLTLMAEDDWDVPSTPEMIPVRVPAQTRQGRQRNLPR